MMKSYDRYDLSKIIQNISNNKKKTQKFSAFEFIINYKNLMGTKVKLFS